MQVMTGSKKPMAEKIMEKRVMHFSNMDDLNDNEIEVLSEKWHTKMNRYQVFVAKIKIREFELTGKISKN